MDRDGPTYGYSLAERIAARTDGGWRPGAGAIYPALQALVSRGLARASPRGRRRVYSITPAGRSLLARVRREWMGLGRSGPDLGRLWSEIAGVADPGVHMLGHLRRHLEGVVAYLEKDPAARAGTGSLRELVQTDLRATLARLDALATPAPGLRRSAPRRRS